MNTNADPWDPMAPSVDSLQCVHERDQAGTRYEAEEVTILIMIELMASGRLVLHINFLLGRYKYCHSTLYANIE